MKYSSTEEINAIIVDDVIIELMSRLLDLSVIPIGTNFYNLLPDEGQGLYDRIQVHILLVKPTLEELEFELSTYKVELLDAFDETAAERERVEALEARFAALSDLRALMERTGNQQPNMKVFQRDIVKENNVALLESLETEDITYKVIKADDEELELDIREGKLKKEVCDECLDAIRGFNAKSAMSRQDIRNMKTLFADLHEALGDGSPSSARLDLEAVDNPTFNGLRDRLLKVLTRRGF